MEEKLSLSDEIMDTIRLTKPLLEDLDFGVVPESWKGFGKVVKRTIRSEIPSEPLSVFQTSDYPVRVRGLFQVLLDRYIREPADPFGRIHRQYHIRRQVETIPELVFFFGGPEKNRRQLFEKLLDRPKELTLRRCQEVAICGTRWTLFHVTFEGHRVQISLPAFETLFDIYQSGIGEVLGLKEEEKVLHILVASDIYRMVKREMDEEPELREFLRASLKEDDSPFPYLSLVFSCSRGMDEFINRIRIRTEPWSLGQGTTVSLKLH